MDRFSSKKQRSTLMPRMFLYHRNSIILITIPYWLRNNHQTLPTHWTSKLDKRLHINGDIFTSPLKDQLRLHSII